MRILCTNDDGIHAPGLKSLEAIARALSDDVWIVAPEPDQSGVAHSRSLTDPLRVREISGRHFAVKGTPSDCGCRQPGPTTAFSDSPPSLTRASASMPRSTRPF